MIPPSIRSVYQYIFWSTVYWRQYTQYELMHTNKWTRSIFKLQYTQCRMSGGLESVQETERSMHRTCTSWRATGESPAFLCQGISGVSSALSVRVSHVMLSLGGTQTCCCMSFFSPWWWSFWLLSLWQQRFLSHFYRFIPEMFALGVKIEY